MKTATPTDWKTEPLPSERATIPLDRTFTSDEMARIRIGLVPEQMEDKWFVYYHDDALFFHRSWTGLCVYVVSFVAEDEGARMTEALANRDPEQYGETSGERDAEMISYLIDVLLLHQDAPFPDSEPSSEESALKNWSVVGRAMFGQNPSKDDS